MYSFTKELKIYKTITFTDDEIQSFIENYKKDCKYWYDKQNQIIPFEEYIKDENFLEQFIEENYAWDLNEYEVDYSYTDIYDFYDEVEKFL